MQLGMMSFFSGSSILSGISFVSMTLFSARYGLSGMVLRFLIAVVRVNLMNKRAIRGAQLHIQAPVRLLDLVRHSMKNILE